MARFRLWICLEAVEVAADQRKACRDGDVAVAFCQWLTGPEMNAAAARALASATRGSTTGLTAPTP